MALATTHPSGYDGDYLTSDLGVISRKGGNNKTVVSLRLVPIGSVIRVFPFTENEEKFVRFKHSELSPCADLNFTYLCCLHECNGKVCQVSMKMSKDEKNSGLGGGTNIATLISHGRTHFTKIQSMTGQKSLRGYLNLLFTVYRMNKSHFLAPQNYRNWQDSIKSMFCSVIPCTNITKSMIIIGSWIRQSG